MANSANSISCADLLTKSTDETAHIQQQFGDTVAKFSKAPTVVNSGLKTEVAKVNYAYSSLLIDTTLMQLVSLA